MDIWVAVTAGVKEAVKLPGWLNGAQTRKSVRREVCEEDFFLFNSCFFLSLIYNGVWPR